MKSRVLLLIEQCSPECASVPLVGYRYYQELSKLTEVTLVTHERNKRTLEKLHPHADITYIEESSFTKRYYSLVERLSTIKGRTIWPLYNALIFPIYEEFNQRVYQKFADKVRRREYDLVHSVTPMMPRYPVKLAEACDHTPFILGPVNGGVPFPKGLKNIARQEFAYFNFLRSMGRWLIPSYRKTYQQADYILAGSSYTLNLIKKLFQKNDDCVDLFFENGITPDFLNPDKLSQHLSADEPIHLLFVGRLVPYKGADMLIEAVSRLLPSHRLRIQVTIAGGGPEAANLQQQIENLQLQDQIKMTGWIPQSEIHSYYKRADIFCFPSVREFGGAVVMEAMGSGLPCIVVDNGGIGEYVTEKTGFKIVPQSRQYIVQQLHQHIVTLIESPHLRLAMGQQAQHRAQTFLWSVKAQKIVELYNRLLVDQSQSSV